MKTYKGFLLIDVLSILGCKMVVCYCIKLGVEYKFKPFYRVITGNITNTKDQVLGQVLIRNVNDRKEKLEEPRPYQKYEKLEL